MELSDLLLSLMSRAYGDILIQGYPNLDLIAPLDVQTLVQENPGKDIKQFLFLGKGTVDLQGKSLELANDRATYLHDPEDMISPSGRRESRLQAGVKYTSPQTFSSVKP
ncbi:hypothetical protein COV16_07400, partial [Candidatus Woesearchaeota archaeon CG10_big_fil_rev_8_21_14_0_10_34_8]